jgi:hypothetical protein
MFTHGGGCCASDDFGFLIRQLDGQGGVGDGDGDGLPPMQPTESNLGRNHADRDPSISEPLISHHPVTQYWAISALSKPIVMHIQGKVPIPDAPLRNDSLGVCRIVAGRQRRNAGSQSDSRFSG